jgi:DNA-binding SARP family transcriptional activator
MRVNKEKIHVSMLGPLSAYLSDQPVTPTAAKQRQILALLALNAGRMVTVSTLVEELWGDDPPRSADTTLQTYILHLRNRLSEAAKTTGQDVRHLLGTRHGGYQLDGSSCQTDVEAFESLVREGRTATEAGDHRSASQTFTQALGMWSGPALADVPLGRILELEAGALEETRLSALERRIEADLALQRHVDLLGELRLLVARNPMNETLSEFLMVALYRSGHAGRALTEYQRLRGVLCEELGIDPRPRLQRLHQAILSRDPALESDGSRPFMSRDTTSPSLPSHAPQARINQPESFFVLPRQRANCTLSLKAATILYEASCGGLTIQRGRSGETGQHATADGLAYARDYLTAGATRRQHGRGPYAICARRAHQGCRAR